MNWKQQIAIKYAKKLGYDNINDIQLSRLATLIGYSKTWDVPPKLNSKWMIEQALMILKDNGVK